MSFCGTASLGTAGAVAQRAGKAFLHQVVQAVNCDGLKIKSKLANLVRIARPKEEVRREVSSRVVKSSNFSIELNLIGYRVEEALEALDKYLDQAVLANVPFVRIVHGMGTGALRTAIWNKLKTYRYVKKYEFAPNAEGSSGVTIVTFKE